MQPVDPSAANGHRRNHRWNRFRYFRRCGTPAGGWCLLLVVPDYTQCVLLPLQPTYPKIPGADLTQIDFFNTLPCPVRIHGHFPNQDTPFDEFQINATQRFKFGQEPDYIPAGKYHIHATLVGGVCGNLTVTGGEWMQDFNTMSEKVCSRATQYPGPF